MLGALALAGAIANPALESDIRARTRGNDIPTAQLIARQVFARILPAQVLKVTVDRVGTHAVAELVISGVKFHEPLTQATFTDEVLTLVAQTFAASPVEEVDVRAVVPISLGRGAVVSGDTAMPTSREVYTLTVGRTESAAALRARVAGNDGIFWDDWFLHQQLVTKK